MFISFNGDPRLIGYSLAGMGFGIYLFVTGFSKMHQKRLIENTPTSKIRSLAMGRVEVFGEVIRTGIDIIAPFTGKKCAYCRWTIEEYKSSGKTSHWQVILQGSDGRFFYLKDDTGSVLVDSDGAHVDIPYSFKTDRTEHKPIREFCEKRGIGIKGWVFNKKMRFTEWALYGKEKVYVMGHAGDNPFVEDASSDKNETDIMIQKGGPFFYISNENEKTILSRYNLKIFGSLIGGGALILGCLAIIMGLFGVF